jgi:hypothetical protein
VYKIEKGQKTGKDNSVYNMNGTWNGTRKTHAWDTIKSVIDMNHKRNWFFVIDKNCTRVDIFKSDL